MGQVATEAESLLPALSAATRGVIIQTPGQRSGVEIAQSKEPNAVFAQNKYLRRAMLVVNQIGYTDSKNVPIDQLAAPRVPLQLSLAEIPVPKSYDSFANTISGWIEAYYSNKTFDDGSIDAGFFSSASDMVGLKVNPEGALKTKYRAYVLMPGSVPGNEAQLAELLPAQREYVEGVNLKNLYIRLFFEDLLAPFVLSFVAGKLAGDKELIKGLTEDLLKAVREVLPGQMELVAAGTRKPMDVFILLVKSMTIDPATGATSGSFQKIVGTTMQFLFKQLSGNGPELFLKNVTEGININGTVVPGLGRLVAILEATDKLLDYANRNRLFIDSTISKKIEFWDMEVDNVKLALTPAESVVVQGDGVVELKVNLRDAKPGEGQFFSYTWSCSSGRLTDGQQGNGKRIEASTADTVSYHAEGAVGETDTVTVQVTLRGPGSKDSQVLGTAEAKVNVVGLTVTPATTTLKNQETVALTGNVAGLRPLKPGETLQYRWLTTRNAGELLGSPDGALSVPVEGTTNVTYRADVAKEGTDTITFEVALAGTTIRLKRTASVAVGKPQDKVLPVIQGVFFDATGSTATSGLVIKCATFKIDPAAQSYSVSVASGTTTTWRIQAKDVAATASGVDTTRFGIDKTWESGFTFPGMTKDYQTFYRLDDTIVALGPTQHWGPNLFFKTRQQAVDSLNAGSAPFEISKAVAHY
jgi:hypothetical protein